MTAPVDVGPQLEPGRPDSSPPSNHVVPGFPTEHSLERVQRYLAPLRRLGNKRVAWIGAALLFTGVFLPAKAATVPFLNITFTASFWDFSKFESVLLIALALASVGLAFIHDYKWLWITGGVSLLFMIIEFFDALTSSYLHPSWGWLILFPAAGMLLAAAALKRDPSESSGNAVSVVRDLLGRAGAAR